MFNDIRERVPNAEKAIFSAHCHDDLGLAVANALAGVRGRAPGRRTINGIGERAGNAALEEFVMAIKTRGDVMRIGPTASRARVVVAAAVSAASHFPVQHNKAIVGRTRSRTAAAFIRTAC